MTCPSQVSFEWRPWDPYHYDVEATCRLEEGHDGDHRAWIEQVNGFEAFWAGDPGAERPVVLGMDFS